MATQLTKKRVRRDRDTSRDQILDKTLRLIGQRGWEASSFSAIAKATKMSTSNIVYHFETREVLLQSLLERISVSNMQKVAEAMKPDFTAYERIVTHVQKNLEWADEKPESAQVLVHIYVSASHDKVFSKLYETMIERAHARIKEHLLAGQREKLYGFDANIDLVTRSIHDLIVGAFIKIMASRLTTPFVYKRSDWDQILKPLLEFKGR